MNAQIIDMRAHMLVATARAVIRSPANVICLPLVRLALDELTSNKPEDRR